MLAYLLWTQGKGAKMAEEIQCLTPLGLRPSPGLTGNLPVLGTLSLGCGGLSTPGCHMAHVCPPWGPENTVRCSLGVPELVPHTRAGALFTGLVPFIK